MPNYNEQFTIAKCTSLLQETENCRKIFYSTVPWKNSIIVLYSASTTILGDVKLQWEK
jgi:hypothetical protein